MRVREAGSLPLMGIGNLCAALAAACIDGPLISLPLMGIGNPEEMVQQFDGQLITPHGDRKPRRVGARRSSIPSVSLPLMGIGNPLGTLLDRHDGVRSLPLMGIGNSSRASLSASSPGLLSSLPLMGIGNPAAPRASYTSITTHYPSWGSETRSVEVSRTIGAWRAHYPSWGSETGPDHRHEGSKSRRSLPLMGIGNPILTGSDGSSVPFGDDHTRSRYVKWTRGPRFVRLSPGAEGVLCSGARCAVHTTDQFFPCQPSSC